MPLDLLVILLQFIYTMSVVGICIGISMKPWFDGIAGSIFQ